MVRLSRRLGQSRRHRSTQPFTLLVWPALGWRFILHKSSNLFKAPNVIAYAGFHRWRYAQRPVDAPEVVEHEMQRDRMAQVLNLLAEPVCQPREAAHAHAHGQVLALNVAG